MESGPVGQHNHRHFGPGYNFPTHQMTLPSPTPPGAPLIHPHIPNRAMFMPVSHPAPDLVTEDHGQMTRERPRPKPSAGSRRIDPLDEDQFFMKNMNGKRPSPAGRGTPGLPDASGDTMVQDVVQRKRSKYEDSTIHLVEGPRVRVPVTKPDYVMGPVKKGVRSKRP